MLIKKIANSISSYFSYSYKFFSSYPCFPLYKQKIYMDLMRIIFPWKQEFIFFFKWQRFFLPRWSYVLSGLWEVFVDKVYNELSWLDCVLDLWWYLGESSVYFALHNKNVVCYEADPGNFSYLLSTLKSFPTVIANNFAVVSDDRSEVFINTIWGHSMWSYISDSLSDSDSITVVPTMHIEKILHQHNFDWLKMDIEWSEFNLLNWMLHNNMFPFKKWYIEFHFHTNQLTSLNSCKEIFRALLAYLSDNYYRYEIQDVLNDVPVNLEEIDFDTKTILFLYFYKKL